MSLGAGARPVRVLVVDDDETVRVAMLDLLSSPSVAVLTADSLPAARETLEREEVDLVITDLRLRGRRDTDGLVLLSWIKRRRPKLPVLLITGLGGSGIDREAERLGAAGCWRKTMPIGDLVGRVRALGVPVD